MQPKIRSDKAIPHCQPRICGPSHWGVVMCFFKCPISTDTHSHWLHLLKLNTRIETMQVEDNIRDMREAIPQCQSRISQRYLRVISLYLSLSYLSKCAAPYLPNTTTQTQIHKYTKINAKNVLSHFTFFSIISLSLTHPIYHLFFFLTDHTYL